MSRIARLEFNLNGSLPCGDADHNGYNEVYGDSHYVMVAFECRENNQFHRLAVEPVIATGGFWEFGDGDCDNKMDLVALPPGGLTGIVESPDSESFPADSVWGEPPDNRQGGSYCYPLFTDLDQDGRKELAIRTAGNGVWLYENCGDNSYYLAAKLTNHAPNGYFGVFDAGDFDRDGLMELVVGAAWESVVYLFEATGYDNDYVLSAVCTTATEQNRNAAGVSDMDHDGWPEFVVVGLDTTGGMRVMVFEATGHAQYRMTWDQLRFDMDPGLLENPISSGDVDGDGIVDFAVNSGTGHLILYKSNGLHSYIQAWIFDSVGVYERLFDINRDGRAEVLFDGPQGTEVWEDTEGLAVAEMAKPRLESRVSAVPTVLRLGATPLFSGIPTDAAVEIHGVDGRLVRRQPQVRQPSWTWDLRDQAGNFVPAGTYFAVIRSKGKSTSLKLCLVK